MSENPKSRETPDRADSPPGLAAHPLALAALVVALGVLVPMVFHAVGLGPIFLPMFLPIAVGAFFLSPGVAAAVGLVTPLISSLTTGMPPWMPPVAPVLTVELMIFGALISWLNRRGLQPLVVLTLALVADRLLLLAVVLVVAPLFGWPERAFSIGAVLSGFPGVLLILAVVPPLLRRLAPDA
ncbi:MAG: ECF transporter S component [Calditrichaeota bacterium]|nr:ECF transporter S component [Calditrichota bacterium]